MTKNNVLRVYFVGNDEDGGEAIMAYNDKDAKRMAFPYLESEWTNCFARWIRDARMNMIAKPHEGHILSYTEGLKCGAFEPQPHEEGPECQRCNSGSDCEGCAYGNNWLDEGDEGK